jgi:hypothetical protein
MADSQKSADYFVMLLSTDWFLPFWAELEFDADDSTKNEIRDGCRAIVMKFIGDAEDYYDISFSVKRRQETRSAFFELLEKAGAINSLAAAFEDWVRDTPGGHWSGIMLNTFTRDLPNADLTNPSMELDPLTCAGLVQLAGQNELNLAELRRISAESSTDWDKYLRGLFAEQPNVLSDYLDPFVEERRLRALWDRLSQRLTLKQRQDLILWYRRIAESHGIPGNPVPEFIV